MQSHILYSWIRWERDVFPYIWMIFLIRGGSREGFWGFQKPVRSDRDTLIEQSVQTYRGSRGNYEVVNKNLCVLYPWKLSVSGQHPTILRCWPFFFGLHQLYTFDQKPVTKNPGATYADCDCSRMKLNHIIILSYPLWSRLHLSTSLWAFKMVI